MSFSRAFFAIAAAAWAAPAAAEPACKLGDICVIQSPLFGCKEPALIQRWIELYVEQDRERRSGSSPTRPPPDNARDSTRATGWFCCATSACAGWRRAARARARASSCC